MPNTRNKNIAKNAIYMYIRMFVLMLVSLYTTRVVLQTLGIDDYGIYSVVGSIVVFFSFINSGLSGATKRYIIAELAIGDLYSQKKIYSLAIKAHLLIVVFIFVAGETIGLWLLFHALNIPESRMGAAVIVYQMSLFTASTNILKTLFNSVIISFEKMSAYAYFSIFEALLTLAMALSLQLLQGDKLVVYAFLIFFIAIISLSMYFYYCHRNFAMCRYIKVHDRNIFLSLFGYLGWTVFGSGANVLSRQGVNMLVNNFFTVAVNAAMGISNTIVNVATQFVQNLQVAFSPQISRNYISKSYEDLTRLTIQSSRYTSYLVLLILIPISCVISNLLSVWLGKYPDYTEEFCLLTLACVFIEAVSLPLTSLITSDKNIGKYQTTISLFYLLIFVLSWICLWLGAVSYSVVIVRLCLDGILVIIKLYFTVHLVPVFPWRKWCKDILGNAAIIVSLCFPLWLIKGFLLSTNDWSNLLIMTPVSLIWLCFLIWIIGNIQ